MNSGKVLLRAVPHLLPLSRHLQRVGTGGEQHHARFLRFHLRVADAGDGCGVPTARHSLLSWQDGHHHLQYAGQLSQAFAYRHYAGGCHHHPARPDDADSRYHPTLSALRGKHPRCKMGGAE